ncbi:MAG: heme exporter protein CcmD [Acetobacter sp.]|nr:heme exporter protein CcmD [Acetobacter sp.]
MTHPVFIIASYGITFIIVTVLSVEATLRLRRARTQLTVLEKNTSHSSNL